ncbi:MAG TPA: DsrE family protein [Chitinophagaceae bacterium]|nr:DsrE family protein [Chitinophagaceae bacterium]
MKKFLFTLSILFTASTYLSAQANYKVVFDVTSQDTLDHKLAIRWATEVLKAEPTAQVEIVLFGKSLAMITAQKSVVSAAITKLAANKNASVKVCAVAMKANNVDMSQLVPGVQTVPDGIYEIITKQRQGWGYIKVSH